MILSCNSCGKKFVVPDQAITSAGRMVQCGSCGNKWKQYPTKSEKITPKEDKKPSLKKTSIKTKPPKPKKKITTKKREINLYSPEYLAKKHGISLKDEINSSHLKYEWTSGSDCEVLIPLYILYGHEMVNKLRGVFALNITIIDADNNYDTFICRDRIGVRPLFLPPIATSIAFSSPEAIGVPPPAGKSASFFFA